MNLYNGWYESGSAEDRLKREVTWIDASDGMSGNTNHNDADEGGTDGTESAAPLKPIIVSEFGASAFYGAHDPFGSQKWSEERQAAILEDNLHTYLSSPDLTGIFVWQFADNRVSEEEWFLTRPRLHNNKGIMDEFRRPKLAYSTVKRIFHECDAQGHQQF